MIVLYLTQICFHITDALNAEMQSESELSKLDASMKETLEDVKKKYCAITKESEFILLIKERYLVP